MFCIMLLNKEIKVLFLQEGSYTKYPPLCLIDQASYWSWPEAETVRKGCLWSFWCWVSSETACSLVQRHALTLEVLILGLPETTAELL